MRPKKSNTLIKKRQSLLKNPINNNEKLINTPTIIKKDNISTNFRTTIKNNSVITNKSLMSRIVPNNISQKMKQTTKRQSSIIKNNFIKNQGIKIQNKNQGIKRLNPEENSIKRTNFRTTKYSNPKKNNMTENVAFNTRKSKLQIDKEKQIKLEKKQIINNTNNNIQQKQQKKQIKLQENQRQIKENTRQIQIQQNKQFQKVQRRQIEVNEAQRQQLIIIELQDRNNNITEYQNAIRSQMAQQLNQQPSIIQIQPRNNNNINNNNNNIHNNPNNSNNSNNNNPINENNSNPITNPPQPSLLQIIQTSSSIQNNLDLNRLINNTQDIISFINRLGLRNQHPTFGMMIDQLNQLNTIAQQVHQLGTIGDRLGYSLVNVFGSRIRQLQTTIINQVGMALIASFEERVQPQFQLLVIRQPSLRNGFRQQDIEKTFQEKITFEQIQCSICLDYVKTGQLVIQLQCHHTYHPICIRTWLENSKKCPYCRKEQIRKE